MIILIAIAFIVASISLHLLSLNSNPMGSDHYYHLSLIRGIKKNRHRFVASHPQLCSEDYIAYPQLYHWILSFLPLDFQNSRTNRVVTSTVILLQCVFFCLFVIYINQHIVFTKIANIWFLLLSGLMVVTAPFQYSLWSAKNMGLSARNFGILLGQLYLYSIVCYEINQTALILVLPIVVSALTLLGSQFAAQMVILSAPILALVMGDFLYLVIPFAALLVHFIVMPKQCMNFYKGQFWHKFLFYRYMAPSFLWAHRHSIWRDFVFDFWRGRSAVGRVKYVMNNPLISIILGMPILVFLAFAVGLDPDLRQAMMSCPATGSLLQIVFALFLVFLATSFRKTRFLGEPERYMEFTIPTVAVLGALLNRIF